LARRKAFAGDNGRVLGYDDAHGRRHRHFFLEYRGQSKSFDSTALPDDLL